MKNIVKIFLSIALMFAFFSCEQHFFYLKKVNVNSEASKNIHRSKVPYLLGSYKVQDSNRIENENIFSSNETTNFEILNASIDTPKPYIIKKLPTLETNKSEINRMGDNKQKNDIQKPKENKFSTKILLGIVLMTVGLIFALIVYTYSNSPHSSSSIDQACVNGCATLFLGALGIVSFISGLILFIIGLIQSL